MVSIILNKPFLGRNENKVLLGIFLTILRVLFIEPLFAALYNGSSSGWMLAWRIRERSSRRGIGK